MDFPLEIEHWEDVDGTCPIQDFLLSLPQKHQVWIAKKDAFFERMTFGQLLGTQYLQQVRGTKTPLLELRYAGSRAMNYRMLCIVWKRVLVGVVIFQGSGGGGKLNKHLKKALLLANDWKRRNP